jgi:hypothetical protein
LVLAVLVVLQVLAQMVLIQYFQPLHLQAVAVVAQHLVLVWALLVVQVVVVLETAATKLVAQVLQIKVLLAAHLKTQPLIILAVVVEALEPLVLTQQQLSQAMVARV